MDMDSDGQGRAGSHTQSAAIAMVIVNGNWKAVILFRGRFGNCSDGSLNGTNFLAALAGFPVEVAAAKGIVDSGKSKIGQVLRLKQRICRTCGDAGIVLTQAAGGMVWVQKGSLFGGKGRFSGFVLEEGPRQAGCHALAAGCALTVKGRAGSRGTQNRIGVALQTHNFGSGRLELLTDKAADGLAHMVQGFPCLQPGLGRTPGSLL
jgi:hypothetical protein